MTDRYEGIDCPECGGMGGFAGTDDGGQSYWDEGPCDACCGTGNAPCFLCGYDVPADAIAPAGAFDVFEAPVCAEHAAGSYTPLREDGEHWPIGNFLTAFPSW